MTQYGMRPIVKPIIGNQTTTTTNAPPMNRTEEMVLDLAKQFTELKVKLIWPLIKIKNHYPPT